MVRIVRGPYMEVVAGAYHISHKWGLITKQNVFHKETLSCNPVTIKVHLSCITLGADSLHGSDMGTDLPDVK
jgi:hypothetical protein